MLDRAPDHDSGLLVRGARARRLPALLALLPLICAACSATRAYEGPERAPEELAVISGHPRDLSNLFGDTLSLLAMNTLLQTTIEDVDGREIGFFENDTLEILPGPHTVQVKVFLQNAGGLTGGTTDTIRFEAVAGGDYEILARFAEHVRPFGLEVVERRTREVVASNEPRGPECVTAEFAFDSRRWILADWGRAGMQQNVSYLPPGASFDDWTEIVEVQYFPTAEPADLRALTEAKHEDLQDNARDVEQHVLEQGDDLSVYTFGCLEEDTDLTQQGLTCLRRGPAGFHLMTYVVRGGNLEAGVAGAWAERFKGARLVPPAP